MEEQFYPTDDGNLVRFKTLSVESKNGTAHNNGQSTFDQETVAIIVSPGLPKSEAVIPVHRKYWDGTERFHRGHPRFRSQFEAWQRGMAAGTFGTPIDSWDDISASDKDRLKQNRIATVEALATVPDTAIGHLGMGGRDLVRKAQQFVSRGGSRAVTEIRAENEQLRSLLEETLARVERLEGSTKSRKKVAEVTADDAASGA